MAIEEEKRQKEILIEQTCEMVKAKDIWEHYRCELVELQKMNKWKK